MPTDSRVVACLHIGQIKYYSFPSVCNHPRSEYIKRRPTTEYLTTNHKYTKYMNTQIHTHIYTSCQVHELKTLHRNGMNSHTKQIATNAPTSMQRILPLAFHPPCDRQSQLRHADIQVTTLALGPLTESVEPKPVSATECPHRNERRCRFQGLFAPRSATMFPPPLPFTYLRYAVERAGVRITSKC